MTPAGGGRRVGSAVSSSSAIAADVALDDVAVDRGEVGVGRGRNLVRETDEGAGCAVSSVRRREQRSARRREEVQQEHRGWSWHISRFGEQQSRFLRSLE